AESITSSDNTEVWDFYKVSERNVLSNNDNYRDNLIEQYKDTKVSIHNKQLTVNNLCSVQYVKYQRKPVEYWMSVKTAELYKQLFLKEGISLDSDMNVLMSLYPDKDCPAPFTELIETNNYLVAVTKEGYLLFFLQEKNYKYKQNVVDLNEKSEFSLLGDPIISNKNFITETNKNCNFPSYDNEKDNQCEVVKLEIYYGGLIEEQFVNQQQVYLQKDKESKYFLRKDSIQENVLEITLLIENNNELIDTLKIYSEKVSETAAITQYYYIDEQLKNIWTVQILADELNRRVSFWKHYAIEDTKHIKLIESISCKYDMGNIDTTKCSSDY
ncbi:hypothetical protein, partial [Gilliamella apis]